MTASATWGSRVRLSGGKLAHRAGQDNGDGVRWLAHGDFAWTETLREAADGAPDCGRCLRKVPELERQLARAFEEDIARWCGCGRVTFWPGFGCGDCGLVVAAALEPEVSG
jgi:hypothetical protein